MDADLYVPVLVLGQNGNRFVQPDIDDTKQV